MKSAKQKNSGKVLNRRARHDYQLGDSLVVGLQLTGAETKALRTGHGQLTGAYVTIKGDELWLVGAQINPTKGVPVPDKDQKRDRKLLAHQREIKKLSDAKQNGLTIVPLELLVDGRFIKLRIAAGKGKRKYDKRETLKKRQQQRDIARTSRI